MLRPLGPSGKRKNLRKIRFLIAAAALGMVTVPVLASPGAAAPAVAPSCTSPSHYVNGEGLGQMTITANMKVAPYSDCGNVKNLSAGTQVYYHCFYVNAYGNPWLWVRIKGTETYGWMSWDNLADLPNDENGDGWTTYLAC